MARFLQVTAAWTGVFLLNASLVRAEDLDERVKNAVEKGLNWVARNQSPQGHWEAHQGQYPTTMTGLGGMALLMEGSTLRDGKYADRIRKSVDWFLQRSQPNGLLGNPNNPTEQTRYIYGHGFGMLFLASVYGEEEDGERRKKLHDLLTRAVEFSAKAQTKMGGWGYVSARDGGGFDEGSTTITQLQGLRACRNAGIPVPKDCIEKAQEYLRKATTQNGGIMYSLSMGGHEGGPALVAAALAGGFSTGEYDSPHVRKWLTYCRKRIPLGQVARFGHDEYTHYYYGQSVYFLGDTGYKKLFPEATEDECMTWTKFKNAAFPHLVKTQNSDGSWTGGGGIGLIYTTAINLTLLQLDRAVLPIYQR
jgi:hypothetical protein